MESTVRLEVANALREGTQRMGTKSKRWVSIWIGATCAACAPQENPHRPDAGEIGDARAKDAIADHHSIPTDANSEDLGHTDGSPDGAADAATDSGLSGVTCYTTYTTSGGLDDPSVPCPSTVLVEKNVQFSWVDPSLLGSEDPMQAITTNAKGINDFYLGPPTFNKVDDTHTVYRGYDTGTGSGDGRYDGTVYRSGNTITFSMNASRGSWFGKCLGPLFEVHCSGATTLLPPPPLPQ